MAGYLGIDVGTSGCRSCLIDDSAAVVAEVRTPLPPPRRSGNRVEQDPALWWAALADNLDRLCAQVDLAAIGALCLDGTSSTLLYCDPAGKPLGPALMYNDTRARQAAARIGEIAPGDSGAHGASASLAKLLWLVESTGVPATGHVLHQADWLLGRLCGHFGVSDENNALKLGYDPVQRRWPAWLEELAVPAGLLPDVVPAGQTIGLLTPEYCRRWGFAPGTRVVSGTTDSTASFIATGAGPGEAVTALGSTLVLKILADQPVFVPALGVYSHRLGDRWLAGGASNSGGAVLQQFFSSDEINRYTACLQPGQPTGLDYYPLPAPGERFPVNDPELAPRLTPRPGNDALFFQAILEGITAIEARGYRVLAAHGAPEPARIYTTGGGAANAAWLVMRENALGVPVVAAKHQQAAYGTALLALRSVP